MPLSPMSPGAALALYNRELEQSGLKPRDGSRAALADAALFAAWCADHDLGPEDAKLYVRARLAALDGRVRVKLAHLGSEKFLASFLTWGRDRQDAGEEQARIAATVLDDHDPRGPELRSVWELQKRVFALEPDLCRATARTMTGGWNPRSPHCRACAIANACKGDMTADQIATREGSQLVGR